MLRQRLRAFFAETFSGLPVGSALCAAVVLLILTFVPLDQPVEPNLNVAIVPSAVHQAEERIAVRLGRNESLQGLLNRFGLRPGSAQDLLQKLYSAVDFRRMPRDQAFSVIVDPADRTVRAVEFVMQDYLVRASVGLAGWSVERQELANVSGVHQVRLRVTDSFSQSAARAGLTVAQLAELQRIFSTEVDLLADLGVGDEVVVVSPQRQYLDGHVALEPMVAARVVHGGRVLDGYAFKGSDGTRPYYDADGHLLLRPFLAAPLKYERISSGFDRARPDPARGVVRPHEAIDYQAPHGTPVVAIGPGVVEFVGSRSGYGLMVELKHAGGYSSSYAHLSQTAAGLAEGNRVETGMVIGAVGRSGYATGPHLHFEFALDGEKLDYQTVTIPGPESLTGYQLIQFRREQLKWLAALRGSVTRVAQTPVSPWQ